MTDPSGANPATGTKVGIGAAALLGLGLLGVLLFWNVPGNTFPGSLSDSTFYLYMADHLSDFEVRRGAASTILFGEQAFPPLYPALLGILGGGSEAVSTAHGASRFLWLLGMLACLAWLWSRWRDWRALLITAAVWFGPTTLWIGNQLLSEGLFIALTYTALRFRGRAGDRGQWILLGLLIAGATLTRTIGAVLLLAVALDTWRHDRGRIGWLLGASLTPIIAWHLVRQLAYPDPGSYLDDARAVLVGQDPGSYVAGIATNCLELMEAIGEALGSTGIVGGIILAALTATGLLRDFKDLRCDALFLVAYCAAIVVWPFPAEMIRFEVVIHALLLHYALLGVRALGQRVLSRDVSTAAGCLLLAVALATGGRMAWRLVEPVPPRLETYRISGDWLLRTSREAALDELAATDGIIRFLAGLRGRIPRRECVYTIAPHLVFHYARAATVSYPAGESIARLNQCNLALALGLSAVQYQLPPYHPLQWLPNPEVLAASAPGPDGTPVALLVRLPDFQDAP